MENEWSEVELAAAVMAYRQMQNHEASGVKYSKRGVYAKLSFEYDRTEKSFEYRMQNISAVLQQSGKGWIKGLKPAVNVGSRVGYLLTSMLEDSESSTGYKSKLPAMREMLIEAACSADKITYGAVMSCLSIDWFSLQHAMNALALDSKMRGEPIITALLVSSTTGRCAGGIRRFGVSEDETERSRIYKYWSSKGRSELYSSAPESELMGLIKFAVIRVRPDQVAFRARVFRKWGGQCAITGCDVGRALDAAHLVGRDWKKGHNSASDGLLLRKDLHALYDAGLLCIDDTGLIALHSSLQGHYQSLVGKRVRSAVPAAK